MKWLLENGGKATAIVSFAVLLLTVCHDWAYFGIIGSKFQSFQTTYDYIANAIEWMPILFLVLIFYGIFIRSGSDWLGPRIYGTPTGFGDQQRNSQTKIRKKLSWVVLLVGLFAYGIGFTLTFPFSDVYVTTGLITMILGLIVSIDVAMKQKKPLNQLSPLVRTAGFAVLVLGVTFMSGIFDAWIATAGFRNVYKISYKGGTAKQAPLLRSFDKGILIWNSERKTAEFLRWEGIDGISHVVIFDNRPKICAAFPSLCTPPSDPI